eukprot:scaffold169297_cov29-Prasinocladus_malaysianus.AAC.1
MELLPRQTVIASNYILTATSTTSQQSRVYRLETQLATGQNLVVIQDNHRHEPVTSTSRTHQHLSHGRSPTPYA